MNAPKHIKPALLRCQDSASGCCQNEDRPCRPPLPASPASPSPDREKAAPPYYHREIF